MSYIIEHTSLGFCWWDIPALIVLIAVVVVFVWKRHNMKKQEKELEDKLAEFYTGEADELEGES